jgi:hypothetical protein
MGHQPTQFAMVLIAFSGGRELEQWSIRAKELLQKNAQGDCLDAGITG